MIRAATPVFFANRLDLPQHPLKWESLIKARPPPFDNVCEVNEKLKSGSAAALKILVTTWMLDGFTGAELYVRDLARGLGARGHEVVVYAVNGGELSAQMSAEGITIARNLKQVGSAPDLIHGHHQPALIDALRAFPQCPAIYVVHDATTPFDSPLPFPRVRRHVAVDERCLARIAQSPDVPPGERRVILNFVDLKRFEPRPPLPEKPSRALVFSNYAKAPAELHALHAACRNAGLELDLIGLAAGRSVAAPETVLGQYDIVFAKARAAIEALAVGCAVVLCDFTGLGEMVTPERFDHLRAWNFGAGVLDRPIGEQAIAAELTRYDAHAASKVSGLIRSQASLDQAIDRWLALYDEVLAEPVPADGPRERASLERASRTWRGVRRVDWVRERTRALRRNAGVVGATYRLGRGVWRLFGSPGALTLRRR